MKFRLTTALLIFGLLGISVGWVVDRINWEKERDKLVADRKELVERATNKADVLSRSEQTFDILADVFGTDDLTQYAKTEIVFQVLEIWRCRDDVEFVDNHNILFETDARLVARDGLSILDCDAAEDFFAIARSLGRFKKRNRYPEIHDLDSEMFTSLDKFVSDTIEIKNELGPIK